MPRRHYSTQRDGVPTAKETSSPLKYEQTTSWRLLAVTDRLRAKRALNSTVAMARAWPTPSTRARFGVRMAPRRLRNLGRAAEPHMKGWAPWMTDHAQGWVVLAGAQHIQRLPRAHRVHASVRAEVLLPVFVLVSAEAKARGMGTDTCEA